MFRAAVFFLNTPESVTLWANSIFPSRNSTTFKKVDDMSIKEVKLSNKQFKNKKLNTDFTFFSSLFMVEDESHDRIFRK